MCDTVIVHTEIRIQSLSLGPKSGPQPIKRQLSATKVPQGNGFALQKRIFEQNERHPSGGLKFKDEADLKKQRGVAWDVIKNLGNSTLEGKDLVNTSLPIYLFEPRSFLERLTDIFAYAPHYLPKAAKSTDPVERLKNVVAFAISGLHLLTTNKKPFNPIIGETYQAHFYDGTEVMCEQTTHHPPASNWELVPPDGSYHYWGSGIWSASCRGNTIRGYQKGPHNIDFADGGKITWALPDVVLKGVMWGDRVMEYCGSMTFTDEKNQIECVVEFNPEGSGFFRSMFSKSGKQTADCFRGQMYRTTSKKRSEQDVICYLQGSWLCHLDIADERFWDIKVVPSGVIPAVDPLPSDSRFREDLVALKQGDYEKGKESKLFLEERQRKEDKLRKDARLRRKERKRRSSV